MNIDQCVPSLDEGQYTVHLSVPRKIESMRFTDFLNNFSVYRWRQESGVEFFFVGEPITGDIHHMYARIGSTYYEFQESLAKSDVEIARKVINTYYDI